MGRTSKKRNTATFVYASKPIKVYQPTEGQVAALAIAKGRGDNLAILTTLHRIVEHLVVDDEKWTWMQDCMISGEVDFSEFGRFLKDVLSHEWPDLKTTAAEVQSKLPVD